MNESQAIFNRLKRIAEASRDEIQANPFPHLDRAHERIAYLQNAINEAYAVLSGVDNWTIAREIAPGARPDLVKTALSQNSKAADILAKVLR